MALPVITLTPQPSEALRALKPQTRPPSPVKPFMSQDPGRMEQCPGFLWTMLSAP